MDEMLNGDLDQTKKLTKVVQTGVFDKQYLTSALKTRIFSIGLRETKSLKSAMKFVRHLDTKYHSIKSPFYFDKIVKHQSKYFWNPYIPTFFTEAFEHYILNEINQMTTEGTHEPGIMLINFDSCGSISRLNTTCDLFLTGRFKIHPNTHKIYIRWNYDNTQDYILGRFLKSIPPEQESWLVIDSNSPDLNFSSLAAKGLKGVIVNIIKDDIDELFSPNTGYDRTRLSKLVQRIRNAGLLEGANITVDAPETETLFDCLKNAKDLKFSFVVLNSDSHREQDTDESKLNRAIIERVFLKANSSKDYRSYPIVFFPEFYKRFIADDHHNHISQCAIYSFQNGSMIEDRVNWYRLFRHMFAGGISNQTDQPKSDTLVKTI